MRSPGAAGAALYVHKAFGIHFVTFLGCFTVMSSGITSASAASGAFASNFVTGFGLDGGPGVLLLIALGFMLLVMAVNLRGVAESVGLNVVLTLIELSGLLLVILISMFAIAGGNPDFSRVVAFETPEDKSVFLAISTATSLALFAVGNSALINMMMASRLLYGTSKKGVLPPFLSKVHASRRTPWAATLFTTGIALALTAYVSLDPENPIVILLGGTTSLLMLAVFAVVNCVVLVLRKDTGDHKHFRAPTALPFVGAAACVYLVLPWSSGRPVEQDQIAGVLLVVGVLLWALTWFVNGRAGQRQGADRADLEA